MIDDALLAIFAKLTYKELLTVARCCRRFRLLAHRSICKLTTLRINNYESLAFLFESIDGIYSRLESVTVKAMTRGACDGIRIDFSRLPKLTSLALSLPHGIHFEEGYVPTTLCRLHYTVVDRSSSDEWQLLLRSNPNLTDVHIPYKNECAGIDLVAEYLMRCGIAGNVEKFCLSEDSMFDGAKFFQHFDNLKELELIIFDTEFIETVLLAVREQNFQLEHLIVRFRDVAPTLGHYELFNLRLRDTLEEITGDSYRDVLENLTSIQFDSTYIKKSIWTELVEREKPACEFILIKNDDT